MPIPKVPNTDTDSQELLPGAFNAVQGIGDRFPIPPFQVIKREAQPRPLTAAWLRPDAIIDLEWDGQIQRFAVEYKAPGTPRQVDLALQQVRRYVKNDPGVAPLIVAPYLRPELLDRLVQERVSGIDLSGNYAVVIPGRWLVLRTGAKNKYPSNAPIKNVYRGQSSLVSRALMLKGWFGSATAIKKDLAWSGAVSLPTISKVLSSLEDELIIERSDGIRVVQPDRLLANLASNFVAPEARLTMKVKLGINSGGAARLNDNSVKGGVAYVADSPVRYTVLPSSDNVTRVYTFSIENLLQGLVVDRTSRFPDVELIETADRTIFYDRRREGDLYWTSPLQVYLELAAGGKREKQSAGQMKSDLLAFRYR